jgi:hypothetical protein
MGLSGLWANLVNLGCFGFLNFFKKISSFSIKLLNHGLFYFYCGFFSMGLSWVTE